MRVILTNNVPKLGEVGDVCKVAPGYGRNYLIPQGLAILALPGALKQIDDLKRTEKRRQDKVRAEMMDLGQRIGNVHLKFTAKVGETGRLYGSITAANIADAIEAEIDEPVDRRKIILDESIRTLGPHVVPIHLMPGVDAHVNVEVEADEELVPDIGLTPTMDEEPSESEGDEVGASEVDEAPELEVVTQTQGGLEEAEAATEVSTVDALEESTE